MRIQIQAVLLTILMMTGITAFAAPAENGQANATPVANKVSAFTVIANLPTEATAEVSANEGKSTVGEFGANSPFNALGWGFATNGSTGGFGNSGPY